MLFKENSLNLCNEKEQPNCHCDNGFRRHRKIGCDAASYGFTVVVNYSGNAAKAHETVNAIKSSGGTSLAQQGNVAVIADMENLFKKTMDEYGAVNVVIHSAGIMFFKCNR